MGYRLRLGAVAVLVSLAILRPMTGHAGRFEDCVRKASELDLQAKVAYQRGTYDLIARNAPKFEPLAKISRDLQIAKAWARAARYVWLMRHDVLRIKTTGALSDFRNFVWEPEDEAAFREANADYDNQARRIEALVKANDGHKDWPPLRKYFTETLFGSDEFRALTKDLNDTDAQVIEIIGKCPAPGR